MALNITPPPVDTPTIGADGKATAVWQKWLQILAARLKLVVDLDSAQTLTNKTLTPSDTWHAWAGANSWVNLGGTRITAGYRRLPDGTVECRGSLQSGTTASGVVCGNLPAGYRPGGIQVCMGFSSGVVVALVVYPDGKIETYPIGGVISSGEITLDLIRFPTT